MFVVIIKPKTDHPGNDLGTAHSLINTLCAWDSFLGCVTRTPSIQKCQRESTVCYVAITLTTLDEF